MRYHRHVCLLLFATLSLGVAFHVTAAARTSGCVLQFDAKGRKARPRPTVPKVILPKLPKRGIYAAGGGSVSSSWRIVLDLDRQDLWVGANPKANSKSFGVMPKHAVRRLSCADLQSLLTPADKAWRERPMIPSNSTVDYGEILILVDGPVVRVIQGYGPIRAVHAKALIDALRKVAEIDKL